MPARDGWRACDRVTEKLKKPSRKKRRKWHGEMLGRFLLYVWEMAPMAPKGGG